MIRDDRMDMTKVLWKGIKELTIKCATPVTVPFVLGSLVLWDVALIVKIFHQLSSGAMHSMSPGDFEPRRSSRKRKAVRAQAPESDEEDGDTIEEIIENDQVVKEKATRLAQMINNSKNVVIFSGAGISTTAGVKLIFCDDNVQDFRLSREKRVMDIRA
jgi:hypothetical protein